MRKLATIRQVSQLLPIPGADRIEVAVVDGWKCVIKKGEFHINDTVVYCEIDSFLPIRAEFEFLRQSSYRKMREGGDDEREGFRLKTVKLRGQISQGLLLPLSVLETNNGTNDGSTATTTTTTTTTTTKEWSIGDDVTEVLGIIQYEDENEHQHTPGEETAPFPSDIPRTDAERVQNLTAQEYDQLRQDKTMFYVTEKLDGTSTTVFTKKKEDKDGDKGSRSDVNIGICSRNLEQVAGNSSPQRRWLLSPTGVAVARKLQQLAQPAAKNGGDATNGGKNYAIQGELVGYKIANNTYKFTPEQGVELYIFSIYDRDESVYLDPPTMTQVAAELGLPTVPVVGVMEEMTTQLPETVEEAIAMADGKSLLNPKVDREGLVWIHGTARDRISIKTISNKYLVKEKK